MSVEIPSTSFDSHLEALGHVDRRRLLVSLLNANTEETLPIDIEQMETDTAESSLRVSMHHVHLPKLENSGFVDGNSDYHSVTTGPRFEEIKPLLELLDTNRDRLSGDWL